MDGSFTRLSSALDLSFRPDCNWWGRLMCGIRWDAARQ